MNHTFFEGVCGRTHHYQTDCEAGDRGVLVERKWAPSDPGGSDWDALERECVLRCRACARCNVVSFSLAERECDWFHDCDPTFLKTVAKPWKTVVVRQLRPPPERLMSDKVPFRSHTAVLWNGSTVRMYIVDDWSAEWVLQESHSESMVTRIFRRLASDCTNRDNIIVDVGANSGYYSLLSAALGCQVVAFEPQPGCHLRVKAAIQLNLFHEAIRLVPRPVGLPQRAPVVVKPYGCHGDYQVRPGAAPRSKLAPGAHTVRFTTVQHSLTKFERSKRIALVKIDTEGAEGAVLVSLMKHMDRIDNLVVETTPWRWPLVSNMTRTTVADIYAALLRPGGFALAYVHSPIAPAEWISDPKAMWVYIGTRMPSHYWGIVDIWFGRDAGLMRSVF
jgi:FkbM family methyltransferase